MLWPLETENWVLPLVIKHTKTTAVNHILGSVISNGMGSVNYSILEEENMYVQAVSFCFRLSEFCVVSLCFTAKHNPPIGCKLHSFLIILSSFRVL